MATMGPAWPIDRRPRNTTYQPCSNTFRIEPVYTDPTVLMDNWYEARLQRMVRVLANVILLALVNSHRVTEHRVVVSYKPLCKPQSSARTSPSDGSISIWDGILLMKMMPVIWLYSSLAIVCLCRDFSLPPQFPQVVWYRFYYMRNI